LVALAGPHYALLTPDARAAVARLAAALVGVRAPGAAALAGALVRHVRSGCPAPENLALATCLAACLADALDWLVGCDGGDGGGTTGAPPPRQGLAQAALLMVARLLPAVAGGSAHGNGGGGGGGGAAAPAAAAAAASFRRAAAALATPLLTEHWALVAPGGRDLAAALGECAGVGEVAGVLATLGAAAGGAAGGAPPPAFSPGTPLARAAPRRPPPARGGAPNAPAAGACRPFMVSARRRGNQGRYQAWFASRYLVSPPSPPAPASVASTTTAAVVDTIRFIVAVYRPPGAVLASEVLPRWALVGWLVSLPRSPAGVAAAAAAAVADWASFDPASDSFMAAEPAALLMLQSLPRYAHVTASILEALFSSNGGGNTNSDNDAALAAGADALVARGVLRSFDRLATAPEVPAPLRARVRAAFAKHLTSSGGEGVEGGEAAGPAAPEAPPAPPPLPPASAPGSASTATVADAGLDTAAAAEEVTAPSPAGPKRRRAGTPVEDEGEGVGDKEEAGAGLWFFFLGFGLFKYRWGGGPKPPPPPPPPPPSRRPEGRQLRCGPGCRPDSLEGRGG